MKALTDRTPKGENWSLGEVIHFHSLLMEDNFSHNKLYFDSSNSFKLKFNWECSKLEDKYQAKKCEWGNSRFENV